MASQEDLRGLFRLLGDVRDQGHDSLLWRRTLVRGFADMMDADMGLLVEHLPPPDDGPDAADDCLEPLDAGSANIDPVPQPPPIRITDAGRWDEAVREDFYASVARFQAEGNYLANPYAGPPGLDTRVFSGIDRLGLAAYRSNPFVRELLHPAGLGDGLKGALGAGNTHRPIELHAYRSRSAPPFSDRERELVLALLEEVGRLYTELAGWDIPSALALSRRQRQVLRLLLLGRSEAEAAAALGLSPHTVHDYVKELYRLYNANSRGELVARYLGLTEKIRNWRI